ncbi:MAG: hypothetical protein LQ339_004883 [Xanthoria mediterranea]|nr:MAG: hypothetical protein LQ339_004883 [Xanthoria mediterranea]
MPPKKDDAPAGEPKQEASHDRKSSAIPSKRKAKSNDAPAKAPRRSARGATAQPDPVTLINHLISPESLDSCRPRDEIEDVKNRGSDLRTYSSSTFSPFEELMCAVILSRPISHALGLRTIRTLLNDPYGFTTPKKIRDGGFKSVIKAVNQARTQHRQKTAEELVILADAAVDHLGDGDEDVTLQRVQRECDHDWQKEMLRKHIKGLGKTGLDIFGRRIQAQWPALYPFADQRTLSGLQKLGLPGTAEELKKLLDHHWAELNTQGFEGNEDEKKRRVFVQVLERAIGVDLEGNADGVRARATPGTENN